MTVQVNRSIEEKLRLKVNAEGSNAPVLVTGMESKEWFFYLGTLTVYLLESRQFTF
jgi:hypothetical protein